MTCPGCGATSDEAAKFCKECGTSLSGPETCSNCHAEIQAGAKFCQECGTPVSPRAGAPALAPSGTAEADDAADPTRDRLRQYIPDALLQKLESVQAGGHVAGERRTVTMLFCDVEGSTSAAETLDPEDWADVINGAFEHLIQPVYKYEGTLARLMGDAILAFFGAPIGHEDDPERAVLASLEILEGIRGYQAKAKQRWDVDFGVRIGINTGLVVVGEVGSDLRVEYTAMGDAVNLAARMEQTAATGTIQVSADTHRLIAPLFDFEDLGDVEVKGKTEPVNTYRVLGEKAEAGSKRGIEGLHSPIVGRDAEVATLAGLLDELRDGRGAICAVTGEAGLGKSRLVADLFERLDADRLVGGLTDDSAIHWVEGQSFSYQTGIPYAPFTSLLEDCLAIESDDDNETRLAKVRAGIDDVLPGRVDDVAPYLGSLMGLELSGDDLDRVQFMLPPELRPRVFEATAELVAATAAERPLVVVLEDLHWADSASIELAQHLMPLTDSTMLLLLAMFRPRREDPSWSFHETGDRDFPHRYTRIDLSPLDTDDGRELVANLLKVEGLPESMRALILDKAEGNPFFVEEVIRSLLDAGAVVPDGDRFVATRELDTIAVPDTLASLLTTRLDRLDDASKLVAYTASVIGRDFDVDCLTAVTAVGVDVNAALAELQRRQLIRETARLPVRAYRFKHGLTQETAYDSSLLKTRRGVHRQLAELLERDDPDAVQDLARHWLGADEDGRAVPYLIASGEQAFGNYSIPEAIRYFRQALDLLCNDHSTELGRRAHEGLAGAQAFGGDPDSAKRTAQELIEFGRERGDIPSEVAGWNKIAFTDAILTGDLDNAQSCLVEAQGLAGQVGDQAGMAEAHITTCFVRTNEGELEQALEAQLKALELGQELDNAVSQGFGYVHSANTYVYLTRFDEAVDAAAMARAYAEETGQQQYLATIVGHTEPFINMRNGKMSAALDGALEGARLADEIGAKMETATALYTAGQAAQALGRWEQALDLQEQALAAGQATGMGYLQSAPSASLAVIHHNLGDADPVLSLHADAQAQFDLPMGNALAAAALAEMGFCALGFGQVDQASEYFDAGLRSASAASHLMRPMLAVGAAFVALEGGDVDTATGLISDASDYVEERGMAQMRPLTALGRGQLAMANDDPKGALVELTDAERLAREAEMLPMAMNVCGAIAQAATAAGDEQAAEAALERYREIVDELAGHFSDDFKRKVYTEAALAALDG